MRIPVQAPPVKRPELIPPYSVVDLRHGSFETLFALFNSGLTNGGNFNDPAAWQPLTYGQLKSL